MELRPTSSQLDETATRRKLRFVDVVRVAIVGILGAASPWVVWALVSLISPLLGYRWDFFQHFPAAKISVPTSVICGGLHVLAEWRSLQRRFRMTDRSVDSVARPPLRRELQDSLSANSENELQS